MSTTGDGQRDPRRAAQGGSGATLRDVAREAGVDVSTVSRVLNGRAAEGRITAATEDRIRKVAGTLGYRRNAVARALRTGRTLIVGMVVPDLANLYQAAITRACVETLSEEGYSLMLTSTGDRIERARDQVSAMLSAQVEGLLYGVAREDDPGLGDVLAAGTPVVLFNRSSRAPGVSAVLPDDRTGAGQAVTHLLELGHRNIVHVGGPEGVSSSVNRRSAYDDALEAAGLSGESRFAERHTEEEGHRIALAMLEELPATTAVVAANDRLALGVIDAAAELGRSCPDDISVVGFNDMPYADRFSPPLTTVRVSQSELGRLAATLILELIADRDRPAVTMLVAPELIVRGSTGPVR